MKTQQDFKTLIAEAERNYNSHPPDLISWAINDLMATFVEGELQLIETVAMTIDDNKAPCDAIIAEAYTLIVRGPKWLPLWVVWKTSKSAEVFWGYFQLLLIRDDLWREMRGRAQGPIGRALMGPSSSISDALLKFLRLNSISETGVIVTRTSSVQQDIGIGALHIFDKWRKESNPQLTVLHRSSSKVTHLKLSGPRWSDWPDKEAEIANEILGFLDLVLSGKIERLPDKVLDSYRGQLRTKIEREGEFDGVDEFPKDGPDYSWAGGDWSKKARENRHSEIEAKFHPEPAEKIKNSIVAARISEVLEEAKKKARKNKRWVKIVKAIEYYLESENQEEACLRAGITPRTFQNYYPKIQKIFTSRK